MRIRISAPIMLLCLALVLTLAVVASAAPQGNARPQGQGLGEQFARIAQELGLSDQQKADAKVIIKDHLAQLEDLKKSNLSAADKQAKWQELRKEAIDKFMAILTPDQQAKAKQMLAERRQENREELIDALKSLNLTDDQKTKIKAIFEDNRAKVQAVQADKSLSDQQKRDQVMQLRKSAREQVMGILTPEQRQKLQSEWKGRRK